MSQEKVDLEPKWYVIHTYSGYENKVKADLEQKVKNQEMEEYFFDVVVTTSRLLRSEKMDSLLTLVIPVMIALSRYGFVLNVEFNKDLKTPIKSNQNPPT